LLRIEDAQKIDGVKAVWRFGQNSPAEFRSFNKFPSPLIIDRLLEQPNVILFHDESAGVFRGASFFGLLRIEFVPKVSCYQLADDMGIGSKCLLRSGRGTLDPLSDVRLAIDRADWGPGLARKCTLGFQINLRSREVEMQNSLKRLKSKEYVYARDGVNNRIRFDRGCVFFAQHSPEKRHQDLWEGPLFIA
jgi:hypothetical protein